MDDPIVCLSVSEWGDVPHSSRHLMTVAHGRGRSVLYVESIGFKAPGLNRRNASRALRRLRRTIRPLRRVDERFWVLTPVMLPLHGRRGVASVNQWLMARQLRIAQVVLRMREPLLWSYMPHFIGMRKTLRAKAAIYHRTDEYGAMPGVDARAVATAEEQAVTLADLCLAAASRYLSQPPLANANAAVWLPNAVDVDHYRGVPEASAQNDSPCLLMMGTLESWLSLEMLGQVADSRPSWRIVLAGPIKTDVSQLLDRKNVEYLGVVAYRDLPPLVAKADVCLVPFRVNEVTRGATPGKLYQYLAQGKPVVATPFLDEHELEELVYVASDDAAAFVAAIERALAEDSANLRSRRREYARQQSWDARFEAVERALAELPLRSR